MSLKLKIIKTKSFEVQGASHNHYTAAYKGRVFGLSTLRWESDKDSLKVEGDTLTISGDVEVLKNPVTDPLTGESRVFLDIVPKSGLTLAEF